jgi:predicted ATPase
MLENWRNFQRVDVELARRVFLFGPNAAGKSNFLDVFRFLHEIVSVGGGFEEAVRRRGGVSKLRCLAARRQSDVTIQVRVSEGDDGTSWDYELSFSQDTRRRPIIRRERVSRDGRKIFLSRPDDTDLKDQDQLRQTYIEQTRVNKDFRDLAELFNSVGYLHIVPQIVRDPDRYRGCRNDPFGWDFLERVSSTPERTRNARLRRIREALRNAVPQLQELELWRDSRGVPHLRGRYEHWRPKGAWQTEEEFSNGTLRLLGLLWSTLEGSGPLLLEEPEMYLHADLVRHIPQMLARMQRRTGRQIVISSHAPDLLRDEAIGLDEVLILQPGTEGTEVSPAGSFEDITGLLQSGSDLAEAVLPRTRQLALFGDT